MRQKGFTLIELLIVIVIVAILAAALIPNILNARSRALQAAAQSYARDVVSALESVQSAFSRIDWQQTAANSTITVVNNGSLGTTNAGWRDAFGNLLNPQPAVNWSDFLQSPTNGIVQVIVGSSAAGNFNNIRVCVSQRAPGGTAARFNIYSLYVNENRFASSLNQANPATAMTACP